MTEGLASLRPAGVVFDYDGLLMDTEPIETVAEAAVFASRELVYGPAEKAQFIGKSVPATVAMMAEVFGEAGNEDEIKAEVLHLRGGGGAGSRPSRCPGPSNWSGCCGIGSRSRWPATPRARFWT